MSGIGSAISCVSCGGVCQSTDKPCPWRVKNNFCSIMAAAAPKSVTVGTAHSKDQENEVIKAHHLPIKVKQLEDELAAVKAERDSLRESLRDRFAMSALQGLVRHYDAVYHAPDVAVAQAAYKHADAMLLERTR